MEIDHSYWLLSYSFLFSRLYFIVSMLIHKDEDVKSEASNKESISVIISIFRSIKCSEDIVDAAKSKVWEDTSLCLLLLIIKFKHVNDHKDAGTSQTWTYIRFFFEFQNSHAICDLGLSITKRLSRMEDNSQGVFSSVSLPSTLYKPYEKKAGDDSVVSSLLTEFCFSLASSFYRIIFFSN